MTDGSLCAQVGTGCSISPHDSLLKVMFCPYPAQSISRISRYRLFAHLVFIVLEDSPLSEDLHEG